MRTVLGINSRVKIGIRILGGFALVLALLAAVSVLAYVGLTTIQARIDAYETIADNVKRVLEIDRDYTDLRRNTVSYSLTGAPATLTQIHELQTTIGAQIKDVTSRLIIPEVRQRMDHVAQLFGEVIKNQNLTFEKLAQRDKLNADMVA